MAVVNKTLNGAFKHAEERKVQDWEISKKEVQCFMFHPSISAIQYKLPPSVVENTILRIGSGTPPGPYQ